MSRVQSIIHSPITISKESTVFDVIQELKNKKISRLLVTEDKKCTSIITEKDVGLFLLSDKTERNLDKIPISGIVKPIISVDSSTSIKDCAKTMIENSIGSLAIKNNGSVIGIVTKTDLVDHFAKNFSGRKMVGEYTTWYYAWEYSDTPLYKAVRKMIDQKISRIILRDHNEIPEGILSFRDLFGVALMEGTENQIADNTDPLISVVFTRKGFLSETGFGATTTAKQVMTDKIISVKYDDDLAQACNVLLEKKINAVGVLSSRNNIIGILSKTDIIKAIAFIN